MEEKRNYKLAIYLLKSECADFNEAIKNNATIREFGFNEKMSVEGKVIVGVTKSREPNWKLLLQEGVIGDLPELNNASNRAIVFFRINDRIFAIPFGYGKHLLKEESIEREFGLKTALNIINADKLLGVDKANIGDLTVLTKTQTARKGTPDYFNIDILKDLLRSITGEPNIVLPEEFGSVVTGSEGLYISPKTNIIELPKILKRLDEEYKKDTYRKRFDWIDNIKAEKDPVILSSLKEKLVNDIKAKRPEVFLAPPFILEWEDFEYISFTPKGEEFTEFNIENFYDTKSDMLTDLDWDKLTRQKIYMKARNSDDAFSISLWRFLNYETEYNSQRYVFTLSNWYKVDADYYRGLYNYCSQIQESATPFVDCQPAENEGEYNDRLVKSNSDLILFDKDLVYSDISRSGIEPCDVFNTRTNEFIHVKFRESSSTLSHLFAQGRVSSNSLRRDKTFRKNLRSKLKAKRDIIPLENRDFNPGKYTITYAIIEAKDRKFVDALPFFSLVNFRLTAEELLIMGFNLLVKKIQIK